MPQFNGVNHFALTVRDLDVSQRFYCDLLGFMLVLDLGYGRLCLHRQSGFSIALLHPVGAATEEFSQQRTGLDHLGFAAESRTELVEWEQQLRAAGVPFTPIQDMPLGHHLNFKDPDGIALEFQAPNDTYAAVIAELNSSPISDDEVRRRAAELLQFRP